MVQFSNVGRVMGSRDHFKNGTSSKSLMSRENFLRIWTRGALLVFLFAQLSLMISYGSEKTLIQNEKQEWWIPILKKHNLEPIGYNNFENVFVMGKEGNSISNGICTLKVATVLIKGYNNTYVFINADVVHYNIKEYIFEIKSGVVKVYKMDSDKPEGIHIEGNMTMSEKGFESITQNIK